MALFRGSRTSRRRVASRHTMYADLSPVFEGGSQSARMPSEIVIDKNGDLHLEVGADHNAKAVTFIVCSKTLARTSPVFNIMLFGQFAEAKRNALGHWIVQLPDDHPHGFGIVMDIIHSNTAKVPVYLDDHQYKSKYSDRLYEIARMTHKYDMVDVVRPWVNTWLDEASVYHTCSSEPQFHGQLLWIAWVFGDERLLNAELGALVLFAYIQNRDDESAEENFEQNTDQDYHERRRYGDSEDLCIVDREDRVTFLHHPEGDDNAILTLLDVADTRLLIIKSLMAPVVSLLARPVVCTRVIDRSLDVNYKVTCTSRLYGEQVFWLYDKPTVTPKTLGDLLRGHNLLPPFKPEDYKGSVVQLYAHLKDLRNIFGEHIMRADSERNWMDVYDLMQELDVVFRNRPPVPLRLSERDCLQRHREKCGLIIEA
ncbi:hypothetical protein BR93DRAFT_994113 [Coniochaeta sp. PMI_546]|nr:hypothetical protein BR93DRAFT_994113 [Coniochaeta sp. PMI_546]